ncbi:hypothetical protein [Spongorhabdus nitratireducens]
MQSQVIKKWRLVTSLFLSMVLSHTTAAAPMDDVFTLLDSGGGVRSGHDTSQGYYITALGFSNRSNEAKGFEEARMEALRHLNEMVNGVTMSGSTYSASQYVSETVDEVTSEYSSETFREVAEVAFKGHLSAVKVLKKGRYDDRYFVAVAISEQDLAHISGLRTIPSGAGSASATVIISTDSNRSIAQFGDQAKTVEAKGLASMKYGEQKARELALQDAMRNAVQQVQGVMLQGKSGAFNEALSFALETRTEGYVGGYDIVDEDIARGSYYIIIMARVNAGQLLSDVSFYLDALNEPVFAVKSSSNARTDWLTDELERLGFAINDGKAGTSHTFYLEQSQRQVQKHNGKVGMETSLVLKLKDNASGDVLFTIMNDPLKSRIYVSPLERSAQVSQVSAYRQLEKKLGVEVIQALARFANREQRYQIVIRGAKRNDVDIFRHVLNNGTSGHVETRGWSAAGKEMTLDFLFKGKLGEAMDQGLQQIYTAFKKEGRSRRPHLIRLGDREAIFEMVQK